MEANLNNVVKELSNINKNLQSINMALLKETRSDDEVVNWDVVLPICRDCRYYHHRQSDVRFCVHLDSCCRAYRLLTKETE